MIEILPILNPESKAANPRLWKLAQDFCEKNLGVVNFKDFSNVWVAVKGGVGEIPEVLGIVCLRFVTEIPLLHTACGSELQDKAVSAKLVQRVWSAMLDQGLENQELLLHVAEEQQGTWKEFLDGINAVPANRYIVRVHPKLEI